MRSLGIDFGERRIGLAISDPEGRWAWPLETLERRTDRQAAYHIAALARREQVAQLVLGEPRRPDGTPSELAERVHRFGARLAKITHLPLVWIGEALTSVEAAARLTKAGSATTSRRRAEARKNNVDTVAAQILLQEALDLGRETS